MAVGKPGWEMTPAERQESRNRHEAYAEQVADMFARGESFGTISKATGIPRSTVQHMCKRLSAEYARERYGDTTAVLGRELRILDALTTRNLPKAVKGDESAARIVLQSHLRRSKLLGLDAAVKAELTVRTSTDIEIERLVAMMRSEPTGDPEGLPDTDGRTQAESVSNERPATDSAGSE